MRPAIDDAVPATSRRVGGSWPEVRRSLEELARRALPPGRVARVRAAFPFGAGGGATVLFSEGPPEALARGDGDPHRLAAILEAEVGGGSADFCASLYFPEDDPDLEPARSLLDREPSALDRSRRAIAGGRSVAAALLRAYRPRRRAQIELRLAGGEVWFAKVERPAPARRAAARRAALSRTLSGELRLPATVIEDPERGVGVCARAEGELLAACLAEPGTATRALARLGRTLVELEHALAGAPGLAALLTRSAFRDALADLNRFAALLRRLAAPAGEQAMEKSKELVAGAAASLDSGIERLAGLEPRSGRRAVVHRDLHDGQVVLGRQVTLLDADQASLGDPAQDLGNLLAHLRLRALQGRLAGRSAAARQALLGGHGTAWSGEWRQAVLAWEAAALLRLTAVYALRPRWSHLSPDLDQAAHALLDALRAPKTTPNPT